MVNADVTPPTLTAVGSLGTLTGNGTLVLNAPTSYVGATTVNAGTLQVAGNGALTQTAATNAVQVDHARDTKCLQITASRPSRRS